MVIKKSFIIVFSILFIFFPEIVFAQEYVMPYPSFMPGSRWYEINQFQEKISEYWHFGSFAKHIYHLQRSDSYLIEAKTLFEYKQFMFASVSLQKSDKHFIESLNYLHMAKKENKDISKQKNMFNLAAKKHIEVLIKIHSETPSVFVWNPEHADSSLLSISKDIENSIAIRRRGL